MTSAPHTCISSHSSLLLLWLRADKLLAPVVQSAVLHPTLGCVAVQRAPPPALRQAANIMQVGRGLGVA